MSSRLRKTHVDKILRFIFGDTLDGVINKDVDYYDEYEESPGFVPNFKRDRENDNNQYDNHSATNRTTRTRYRISKAMGAFRTNLKYSCGSCENTTETVFCNECKQMFHAKCAVDNRLHIADGGVLCDNCVRHSSSSEKQEISTEIPLSSKNNLDLLSLVALKEYTEFPNNGLTNKYEYTEIIKILIKLKHHLTPEETHKLMMLISKETGLINSEIKHEKENGVVEKSHSEGSMVANKNTATRKTPLINFMLGICQAESSVKLDELVELMRGMLFNKDKLIEEDS